MQTITSCVRPWVAVLALAVAGAVGAQAADTATSCVEDASVDAVAATPATPGDDHAVTICHKGKVTLSIDQAAWPAHEAHGDTVGACVSAGCLTNADCAPDEFCQTDIPLGSGGYDVGHCGEVGTCEPIPDFCIFVYDPVCGCDGMTYGNDCVAHQSSVNIEYYGECGSGG